MASQVYGQYSNIAKTIEANIISSINEHNVHKAEQILGEKIIISLVSVDVYKMNDELYGSVKFQIGFESDTNKLYLSNKYLELNGRIYSNIFKVIKRS